MSSRLVRARRLERPLLLVTSGAAALAGLLATAACARTDDPAAVEPERGGVVPAIDAGVEAGDAEAPPCGASSLCPVSIPLAYGYVTSIVGRSATDVWASGTGGLLMHWNGGQWLVSNLEMPDTISSLYLSQGEVWGVAGDLVVRASLEPQSVRTTRLENGRTLRSISMLSSGDVFVGLGPGAGSTAKILGRLDFDTKSLTYLENPIPPWAGPAEAMAVRAGFLVAGSALWLVGDHGSVARYPIALLQEAGDAGSAAAGTVLPTTSRASLLAAWGYGEQLWAAGSQGTVLHFDGSEWHAQQTGTQVTLNAIFGTSGTDIWAAGDDGTVLHFDGKTWAAVDVGSYRGSFRSIWAATPDDVWLGGEGTMFHRGANR
jgi:hypothetical protein